MKHIGCLTRFPNQKTKSEGIINHYPCPIQKQVRENEGRYKMRTINRTAITIIPKQPYIDWMNNVEDTAGYDKNYVTTILIPEKYDEFNS